jgi:organic hydroperoxide reductase OsmC/OhrA
VRGARASVLGAADDNSRHTAGDILESFMSVYTAAVRWRRKPDERFLDGRYSRAHQWAFDGGARVAASSSPHVVRLPFSDPAGVDPEEALVASLASCHMLFFLDFAKQAGFVVDSYDDEAEGLMEAAPDGRVWMARVTLKPRIVFAGDKRPRRAEVDALHHRAHEACYIANSVKSEVRVEGSEEGVAEG